MVSLCHECQMETRRDSTTYKIFLDGCEHPGVNLEWVKLTLGPWKMFCA
jgi:hypothetical protein